MVLREVFSGLPMSVLFSFAIAFLSNMHIRRFHSTFIGRLNVASNGWRRYGLPGGENHYKMSRKLTLFAYSSFGRIYVFLVLSSISSPAFVMPHKTKKLFHLINSSKHFFVLFSSIWQIGFCIFCGVCLSLRMLLKVATVNDTS